MTNTMIKRRRDEKGIMPDLPGDIVDDIILMLPAKSICRFKCVCKHWQSLFQNPNFTESRLQQSIETEGLKCYSIDAAYGFNMQKLMLHITKPSSLYTETDDDGAACEYVKMDSPFGYTSLQTGILGSCNGLILMSSSVRVEENFLKRHWLRNPYTEEFKEILIPEVQFGPFDYHKIDQNNACSVAHGVSYNCHTSDYKLMVATSYRGHSISGVYGGLKIQVYTSETNSWKTLPNIFLYEILDRHRKSQIVFVHGAFHWIVRPLGSEIRLIVYLDIDGENINEVAVTPQIDAKLNCRHYWGLKIGTLGMLGGSLCIVLAAYCSFDLEVWVKKDHNVTESWTKSHIVQLPVAGNPIGYVKLLWGFKNGEVLFATTKGSYGKYCGLVLYDPVSQKCKVTKTQHNAHDRWNLEAYAE